MDPKIPLTILAIAMILSVCELGPEMLRRRRRTRTVVGKVSGSSTRETLSVETGSHSPPTFHAIVEYSVEGRRHEVVCDSGVSWRKPAVGGAREVAYEPGNPENAAVRGSLAAALLGFWLPAVGLPLGGVVLLWMLWA